MRLDKFLKIVKIFKRRTLATESAKMGFISINGKIVKASHIVAVGDIIELSTDLFYKKFMILNIPQEGHNIKKTEEYVQIIADINKVIH
jgi:ribosomal 50S subunit-recycling heat shock protein